MAYKYREEIVGKRFLSVRSEVKPKLKQIADWEWRGGVVRAASQRDLDSSDVMVRLFTILEYSNLDLVFQFDVCVFVFLLVPNLCILVEE